MGLEGKLEDLPLIELLQIVAFAKKTGYLRVKGASGRGIIIVRDGRVLFGCSWRTLEKIRTLAKDHSRITEAGNRDNVETALRDLVRLEEGSFRFELTDEITDTLGGVTISPFMVQGGMDPQELLLDLAVEKDNHERELTTLLELAFRDGPESDNPVSSTSPPSGAAHCASTSPSNGERALSFQMLESSGVESDSVESATATPDEDRKAYVSRMTRKLVEQTSSNDVSALVLRVAERFVERCVLFLVQGQSARGIAGFGFAAVASECVSVSRRIRLDVGVTAPLGQRLSSGGTLHLSHDLRDHTEAIVEEIGQGLANEGVFVPMRANGATTLLLYGDNGSSASPLHEIEVLELFVAQAGMALENKLLQRKLDEMDEQFVERIV